MLLDENGNEADLLSLALRKSRFGIDAEALLKDSFPIDDGERYLADAVEFKHSNIVAKLLETADINAKYDNGNSVFSEVLLKGAQVGTIEHFLNNNVNIDDKSSIIPILIAAAENNNITAKHVEKIVELGGDVNAREFGTGATPLIKAVKAGRYETVKALLYQKADIYLKDSEGNTAADYAKGEKFKKLISDYDI